MNSLKGRLLLAVFHLCSWLPWRLLQSLGRGAGNVLWWTRSRSRRTTETNLALCFPEVTPGKRAQQARTSLQETGITALEIARIWYRGYGDLAQRIVRVSGAEHLAAARAAGKGVIVLGPHHGNWEVAGLYCASVDRMTSMFAPAKLQVLDALMMRGRTSNGATLVPANVQGVKALLKALKSGEMIGILPDQVPELESGVYADFFGRPAFTMTLVATLARRTGAAVICCYAQRLPHNGGFEIRLLPADGEVAHENPQVAARALNRSVERCVLECPEQYQWSYKRFRKQPDGSRPYN